MEDSFTYNTFITPSSVVTLILLVSATTIYLRSLYPASPPRPPTLAPEPPGLPVLGHSLAIRQAAHGSPVLDDWAHQYGDVFSVRFGSFPGVVLSSPKSIREAFVKLGGFTSGRPTHIFFFRVLAGSKGVIQNEGAPWKTARRLSLHLLRDLGMGKKSLESSIQQETKALIDVFDATDGKPFDPKIKLHNAFSNVICSLIFGDRYEYGDPEFLTLSGRLNTVFSQGGFKNPAIFIPWMTPLIPFLNPSLVWVGWSVLHLRRYIKRRVKQLRKSFDPDDLKCLIDICIKSESEGNVYVGKHLPSLIFDLFMAGSETSTTTMSWMLLYLCIYPEVQERCRKRILEVLGQERLPSMTDRPDLLYIDAVICESQRLGSIAAFGVLHRATKDIEVSGYTIPKDYIIMPNFHHVNFDPEYWDEPFVFKPERWIGEDGTMLRHDAFMPFSLGPRECLGKGLALQEMFIVLVSLLQRFVLTPGDPDRPLSANGVMGFTYSPDTYHIVATRY